MSIKETYNSGDIEALLSENSKQIIEEFLTYYRKSSQANMRTNVYRLLYDELSEEEVSNLTFEDYLKVFPDGDKTLSSQERYKHSFFRFIYAFNYLLEPKGFEKRFIQEIERRSFTKPTKSNDKKTDLSTRKILTLEELTSIQKVIEVNSTKLDTLKMQFCWLAIFELGLDVDELRRNVNCKNFSNGKLHVEGVSYNLDEKFHYMFEKIRESDTSYDGFWSLKDILEKLGEFAHLERKLIPSMVKQTRKAYMVTCGNCGNQYTNLSSNWASINNRIVCIKCGEALKKKLNFEVTMSPIENINIGEVQTKELSLMYSYEDLKQEIKSSPIDYLGLHKLQMKVGQLGEAYVYEQECKKLAGTKYISEIDENKASDPKNGYDILSFTREGELLHIEVKATTGKEETFYLSNHEYQTAKKMKQTGMNYVIYFVKEVMSDNPKLTIIHDISDNKEYEFEEMSWKITRI